RQGSGVTDLSPSAGVRLRLSPSSGRNRVADYIARGGRLVLRPEEQTFVLICCGRQTKPCELAYTGYVKHTDVQDARNMCCALCPHQWKYVFTEMKLKTGGECLGSV
ncbi:unnamed protein product, partial [Laminaria digitata]